MVKSFESDANDNNMVKHKDSGSSAETKPSHTLLGCNPVPITSSCQSLLDSLEEYSEDIPFASEILKKSAVDFTKEQLVLVNDVLEAAEIESRYGIERQFYVAITALWESLESRIKEEKEFFDTQRRKCMKIYEILTQSSFPYSVKQTACLARMLAALYQLTGNPKSEAYKEFRNALGDLIRLMQSHDHLLDQSPHRFVITSIIHYCFKEILTKVDELAKEEAARIYPEFVHPDCEVDLASHLVINLDFMMDGSKVLTQREHFHHGMVEIYSRFVEIFKSSGLEFSAVQDEIIKEIEDRIQVLKEWPLMIQHIGIVNNCRELMIELEEASPEREYKLEDDKLVLAPEGVNNREINKISWDLVYLQHVATAHLVNFPSFGHGVENIIAQVTERFLALYPMP